MRLEWRFERELGIMFGVEFKGNEEYFSQLSSGTQPLPKGSYCLIRQGPKSSVSLGPVRSVYRNLSREHGGSERTPGVVKRFKPTKCRGYQLVLQYIGKQ